MQYIICDIGGTTTRIAQASEESLTMDPIFFPTEQDFTKELHLLKEHITSMHMNEPIHSMVVGLPGALSKDKSTLYKAPHLPDWNGRPLRDELSQAFQTPVFLESDAALVGLGEAVYGAGKGQRIVAYLTISTGVGGARIVDEKIDAATYGFEPGHQFIALPDLQGAYLPQCTVCPLPGHLEAFVGGEALHHRHEPGRLRDVLTDQEKTDAARYLAFGIYNMLMFWSPGIVVLGGGLIVHDVIDLDEVRKNLRIINSIIPELSLLVKGELRDVGGLYGGIAYMKTNTF